MLAGSFMQPERDSPVVAGFRVLERNQTICFRLPTLTAAGAAFVVALAVSIVATVFLGIATGGKPPLLLVVPAFVLILIVVPATYYDVARRINAGTTDLVIDRQRGTLTLPQTFGREKRITIRFADLAGVRVNAEEKKDGEGNVSMQYVVVVQWRLGDGPLHDERLAELTLEEAAKDLAMAIRHEVIGPELPPVVG